MFKRLSTCWHTGYHPSFRARARERFTPRPLPPPRWRVSVRAPGGVAVLVREVSARDAWRACIVAQARLVVDGHNVPHGSAYSVEAA